jgi:16S rRNA (cytidine1402-2'-O)-methyltransferase
MDMGTAARALKKAGDKNVVPAKNRSADRAYPVPVPAEAVNTAPDVHEPVFTAVQRRKGRGTYHLPIDKPGGTYRADLWITWYAFASGSDTPASAETASKRGDSSYAEKKGIAKPEQNDSDNYKNQNFKNLFHTAALAAPPSPIILFTVAVLYIIGTPIGNLGDLSYRAAEIFKKADLVACEDTRQTLKLLSHFGISVKMISCRAQNEESSAQKVIACLNEGKTVVYASDAGTPALSDPGAILARRAAEAGHDVIPIPGPSAFAALLSVSGGFDKSVLFVGFLSAKPGRRRSRLKELLNTGFGFILYESPFRVIKLFEDLVDLDNSRYVCVGREMTKVYEEYLRGSAEEICEILRKKTEKSAIRGEFSVFVSGKKSNYQVNYYSNNADNEGR